MPTKREREYYRMGYKDGLADARPEMFGGLRQQPRVSAYDPAESQPAYRRKPKRKLSAWNKFVKANSKKPRFRYRNGKLNLKKMAIAFRKTPQGKKKRR